MRTLSHQKRLVVFLVRLTLDVLTFFEIPRPDELTSRESEVSYNFDDNPSQPFHSQNQEGLQIKYYKTYNL